MPLHQDDSLPTIRFNWPAYYKRFAEVHGGSPVTVNGRLLFRDGWQYSSTDYKGPEWPAPSNPEACRMLQRLYWLERRKGIERIIKQLQTRISTLREWQERKSAPLQQTVIYWDEEQHKHVREVADLNLRDLEDRLGWYKTDLEECTAQLNQLNTL